MNKTKILQIINDNNHYMGDKRLYKYNTYNKKGSSLCIYCSKKADTREHIPSKAFLYKPLPESLGILPSCEKCNNSYSGDELYISCLIEYLKSISGISINFEQKLNKHQTIYNQLKNTTIYNIKSKNPEAVFFDIEKVERIIKKLAIGHAIHHLSEIHLPEPKHLIYKFINDLSEEEYRNFNAVQELEVIPELGARGAKILQLQDGIPINNWITIQKNHYRFLTLQTDELLTIRIVIGEFLFAEIVYKAVLE